jgi:hypothetical protein
MRGSKSINAGPTGRTITSHGTVDAQRWARRVCNLSESGFQNSFKSDSVGRSTEVWGDGSSLFGGFAAASDGSARFG